MSGPPPRERRTDKYEQNERRIRDAVIFFVGVAGSINEIFLSTEQRPYLLAFLASLIGVPFILKADALRRNGRSNDDDTN